MAILLQIDHRTETAWRCQALTSMPPITFDRIRSADWAPDRLQTTVRGQITYYLEIILTGCVLLCWTASPVDVAQLTGLDTATSTLKLKSRKRVPCQITRRHPTPDEQAFIQQERLIESNHAVAAALRAAQPPKPRIKPQPRKKKKKAPAAAPPPAPEINDTILWHVQQKIVDELDPQLKSAPSASLIFTCYCRDRLTLAEMRRRYHWPYRTLKSRKAALETFLHDHFNQLTLAAFFVDRSIFRAAERQLKDHRARHISPRALTDDTGTL